MSTRSVIARKTETGFIGSYHHWDGYPSGLGSTLFELRNIWYSGDTERMLRYLIDEHPAGWSTICADWSKPAGPHPDRNLLTCKTCGLPAWMHYRQYYSPGTSGALSYWEMAGQPPPPPGSQIMVLGHSPEFLDTTTGPEPCNSADGELITHEDAAECGCEYAYVFNGADMEIYASMDRTGNKMVGMFGFGDPESDWRLVCTVSLDGPEPDWEAINEMAKTPPAAETPTEPAVVRYEHLDKSDPDYKEKMRAQLDQFEQDAKSGKVLCLSDLMISAGM